MQSLMFWKGWAKDYRLLWYVLATMFVVALLLVWTYYFLGANAVIDWERLQEQKIIETTVHHFRLGPFEINIPTESYVIFEYLGGSMPVHNDVATWAFFLVLSCGSIVLLSIITTLERLWYFAGMSLFIIFMISLRLDVLHLFGVRGYVVPGTVLFIYVAASFYFRYYRVHTSFLIRCSTFLLITFLLTLAVIFFAKVTRPDLHLLVTAYSPALILSILFIVTVAHEIMVSFVAVTNQGTAGSNAKHFSLISAVYLIYVIITCLHELGVVNWNFVYFNVYLLLTISAILGIWGFRIREAQYENIFPFAPFGAFFYLALGSICFVTIAQLLGNANDSAIQVVRYTIIFAHTGFGIIFLIYFFSNFLGMMAANIPVYLLLYKPNRMPYFTFRFAGVIASLAFLFYSNWRDFVSHGVAGFYNYVADMYIAQGDEAFAQTFLEQSRSRSFRNNRANYILASLKSERLDFEGAAKNYQQSNGLRPTEFSLANEGNLFLYTGRYFDAIKIFRKAEERESGSSVIKNNLGYAYAKIHGIDSATYYFSAARKNTNTRSSAESNFFAMAAVELIPIGADSVRKIFESNSPAVDANALAVANLFRQKIAVARDPLGDTTLNLYTATYLNNYINLNIETLDTAFINRAYHIASDSANLPFREALKASLANAYYRHGKVYKALEIMAELAYITQNYQGKFNYIMGLWALEQRAPEAAASYFSFAHTAEYKDAPFYSAIALTEAGKINEALLAWDSLQVKGSLPIRQMADQVKTVLLATPAQALEMPDPQKYQYCRYKIALRDTVLFKKILNTFQNDNYKGQALLDLANRFYKADLIIPAIRFFDQLTGLKLTDKNLYDNIRHFELLMLASRNEIRSLATQINKDISFDDYHQLQKILYTAMISEGSGDSITAEKNYRLLSTANPYFEEGILASVNYFRNKDPQSLKPYNILVEAIYVNKNSIRLLKAYAGEASRKGFDEYAASAAQRLDELESTIR